MEITKTLAEREKTHGSFESHAKLSQALKVMFRNYCKSEISQDQAEALEMIFHKIARIGNGNPDVHDHWHDIAGYATLVANRLITTK